MDYQMQILIWMARQMDLQTEILMRIWMQKPSPTQIPMVNQTVNQTQKLREIERDWEREMEKQMERRYGSD